MKILLVLLFFCSVGIGSPSFFTELEDLEDVVDGTGAATEENDENIYDGHQNVSGHGEGPGANVSGHGVCGEKAIQLDEDEKEIIEDIVDGLAMFISAAGKLLHEMEKESREEMKEFLDKVREGEDREAVRVVGEHSIKMGIKSHRMMGYAFRYANESGLFEEKDIEEGVKEEFEYDGDVLEQAQKLVKRAKDGNCDATYVKMGVTTALSGMKFAQDAWTLKQKVYTDIRDLVEEVAEELEECNVDQAEKLVGNAVLSYMRRAMKIGAVLHKINQGRPRPSKGPRPSGSPRPTGRPQRTPRPRPSKRPSGHPPRSPSQRPSGPTDRTPRPRPSGRPSGHPPSSPRPRPSGRPSGHPPSSPRPRPSGRPSGHPPSSPKPRPSGRPSGHPPNSPRPRPPGRPRRIHRPRP